MTETVPLQPITPASPAIEPPVTPAAPASTVTPPVQNEEKKFTQADLDRVITERLAQEKRVAEEKSKKQKDEDLKKELTEKQEWQKLAETTKKELDEAKALYEAERLLNLKRTIGIKHNIPLELVDRLKGETETEIEADAVKMAAFFIASGQPPAKLPVGITPTNPKGDATVKETIEEKRKRLLS